MEKHRYKVIFDHDLQRSVVVSELAKSYNKPASKVCFGDVVVFHDRVIGGRLKNSEKTDRTLDQNVFIYEEVLS